MSEGESGEATATAEAEAQAGPEATENGYEAMKGGEVANESLAEAESQAAKDAKDPNAGKVRVNGEFYDPKTYGDPKNDIEAMIEGYEVDHDPNAWHSNDRMSDHQAHREKAYKDFGLARARAGGEPDLGAERKIFGDPEAGHNFKSAKKLAARLAARLAWYQIDVTQPQGTLEDIAFRLSKNVKPSKRSRGLFKFISDSLVNIIYNTFGKDVAQKNNKEVLASLKPGDKVHLVLHGYWQNEGGPLGYQILGKEHGEKVYSSTYNYNDSTDKITEHIRNEIATLYDKTQTPVRVLGHSSGGTYIMKTLAKYQGLSDLVETVTVAHTAVNGAEWGNLPAHKVMQAAGMEVPDEDLKNTPKGRTTVSEFEGILCKGGGPEWKALVGTGGYSRKHGAHDYLLTAEAATPTWGVPKGQTAIYNPVTFVNHNHVSCGNGDEPSLKVLTEGAYEGFLRFNSEHGRGVEREYNKNPNAHFASDTIRKGNVIDLADYRKTSERNSSEIASQVGHNRAA